MEGRSDYHTTGTTMSNQPTTIRRMYAYGSVIDSHPSRVVYRQNGRGEVVLDKEGSASWIKAQPILVVPDNPAARQAMVDKVVAAAGVFKGPCRLSRATIEYVLATALAPTRRKKDNR